MLLETENFWERCSFRSGEHIQRVLVFQVYREECSHGPVQESHARPHWPRLSWTASFAAPWRTGREMKTCGCETGLSGLPYGNGFPNAVCHARLHESGHSRDKWSRKVCLGLSAAPGCYCLGQALQLEFGSTLWR